MIALRLLQSFVLLSIFTVLFSCSKKQTEYNGWPNYAGTKDAMRYSSNDQITTENVHQLEVAWRYSTHDKDPNNRSQNQCNPIVVDGILYGTSPRLKAFAINAATGEELWIFDPAKVDSTVGIDPNAYYKVNRGVTYWQNESGGEKRIFYSAASKTYCLDAETGQPIPSFAKAGYINLPEGLDREPEDPNAFVVSSTPGMVYKNLLIMGSRVAEAADGAPGHVRAYDVRTGERKWIFHTIPHPGEKFYDTWPDKDAYKKLGGANSWAGFSLDEERGILYVPTGSISGDFYGGLREGPNLIANSLIALDAATGEYIWHYQVVHHDIWDRDLAATPNLFTLEKNGEKIPAVAQITKHGYVFVFNRVTGEPLFPIEEKAFPQRALPGEKPWPTQPIPTLPEPFARQQFLEEEVTNLDSITHTTMLEKYRKVKYKNLFDAPSTEGAWVMPGYDGGGEWGGASIDPESQVLYVNSSEMPWIMTMIEVPEVINSTLKSAGKGVYTKHCLSCHGTDLKGNGTSYPSLVNIADRYTEESLWNLVQSGKNMMPAFNQIDEDEKRQLLTFLLDKEDAQNENSGSQKKKSILDQTPYVMTGYFRFLDDNGHPGITPPWGNLNAIDLKSGKILWKVPLGEYPELTARGIPQTGTENYGGPVSTKGGLVFIAASKDKKIRAFDKKTGKTLWEANLPASGFATPAVYAIGGRQFVVIACGGGKIDDLSGDEFIAFALPE